MATEAILDSSVIVALTTPEKYSEWVSKKIANYDYLHVLDLSFYEVANALNYKSDATFNAKDVSTAFRQAEKIMNLSSIHSFHEVITDALNKALELRITVYDAAFVALADKRKMKFLTLDTKLVKNLEPTKYAELIECP